MTTVINSMRISPVPPVPEEDRRLEEVMAEEEVLWQAFRQANAALSRSRCSSCRRVAISGNQALPLSTRGLSRPHS